MFKWIGKSVRFGVKEVATLTNYRQLKEVKDGIQQQARVVLDPRHQRQGREETFQNAYNRLDLDEATLAKVYTSHRLRFYISMVFLMGAIGLGVVALLSPRWWNALPAFAAVAVCLSQMFNSSLRAYQINHRELVGVMQWWDDSKEWWPGPFVDLDEFKKRVERAARRAERRASRKSSSSDIAVTNRKDR